LSLADEHSNVRSSFLGLAHAAVVEHDKEVAALMEAIERLSRDGANEVARCLLRAALGHERTGDGVSDGPCRRHPFHDALTPRFR